MVYILRLPQHPNQLHQNLSLKNYSVCLRSQLHQLQADRTCAIHTLAGGCSGVVVEYRTRNREVAGSTQSRSTASNLEQVANLLCAQANSASYPQRDGKWVIAHLLWATGWRPSVPDCGDGVCYLHRGSNCALEQAVDGHIMCGVTIGSCQSAAIFEIVKCCWSWVWLM